MSAPVPEVRHVEVGRVGLSPDVLIVSVVLRSWTTRPVGASSARPDPDPGKRVRTVAPASVVVARQPDSGRVEPGGMSARAARALAVLLAKAAAQAEEMGTASLGDGVAG